MNKVWQLSSTPWQSLVAFLVATFAVGSIYVLRIGSLTQHLFSDREAYIQSTHKSLHGIVSNPLNAPYKLVDYVFLHIQAHNAVYARLASVCFAFIAIALFFIIVLRWHGKRTAILTTVLFGVSSWMLHVGRLGTGDVLLVLIPLSLILLASWVSNTEQHGLALLCMTLISGLAFYTPGAIWFLIVGYILIRKSILNHVRHARLWEKTLSAFVVLLLASALGYAVYKSPHLLRDWLFIPSKLPSPFTLIKQWVDSVLFLFVRGPYLPDTWLAHTPILDVFTSTMTLLGGYFYLTHYKNLRTHVLISFFMLGTILVALNGAGAMGYLIPVAYLLASTGITYLLHQWLTVFPRNPIARTFGILLVSGVVVITVGYHITNYFVAWHYSPSTIQAFQRRP